MTDFWTEVERLLDPPGNNKIFYRLYYDDGGSVLFYSMEDLPGNYIDIDLETFRASESRVRVINGKIIPIENTSSKLVPAGTGVKCHAQDVSVIVDGFPEQPWQMKNYERNY